MKEDSSDRLCDDTGRCFPGESQFRDFVRVQGDQLVEDGKPFRFISWNIPNLHLVEDYIPFEPPVSATGGHRGLVGLAVAGPI